MFMILDTKKDNAVNDRVKHGALKLRLFLVIYGEMGES